MNYWSFPGIGSFNKHEYYEILVKKKYKNQGEIEKALLQNTYMNYVIYICKKVFDVKDMYSKSRKRNTTEARFAAWYLLKNILLMSYVKIGYKFNKDHSTVIHGVKEHKNLYEYEVDYKNKFINAKTLLINKMTRDENEDKRNDNK